MKENGVLSSIISLGGNVQALRTKTDGSKWKVAIQDTDDKESFIGVISISDVAVYVMWLDEGAEYWRSHDDFDVIFITDDDKIMVTKGIADDFENMFEYNMVIE